MALDGERVRVVCLLVGSFLSLILNFSDFSSLMRVRKIANQCTHAFAGLAVFWTVSKKWSNSPPSLYLFIY